MIGERLFAILAATGSLDLLLVLLAETVGPYRKILPLGGSRLRQLGILYLGPLSICLVIDSFRVLVSHLY